MQILTATVIANLAKLNPEDLKLVLTQNYCPIQYDVPLGAKGVPVMIMLKGQPVFLCCRECIKKAQANPEETLARVEEAKKRPGFVSHKEVQKKIKQMSNSSKDKK